jgi:uncharacterized protein
MNSDDRLSPPAETGTRRFPLPDLLSPVAYPHAVTKLQLRETNLSWVILTGLYAYKIKKAVHFDFIDTTNLARRKELCREELRLNRRLAADLYDDVVAITRDAAGLRIAGQGAVVEYAVRMRQFDPSQEFSALLARGEVQITEMTDLAESLARFHAAAALPPPSQEYQRTNQLNFAVLTALAALRTHATGAADPAELERLTDWTRIYLQAGLERLHLREQSACIRECHGDLHAGNIVRWQGALTPFDCLEFDPKLRYIDVLNDVAFLVMDLVAHGRDDLGACFLNRYLECTGDYSGVPLLPLYAVYRALVRAMVDALGIESDPQRREYFQEHLRTRMSTARDFTLRPRPLLVLMHGASGSGKSWLSERLIGPLAAIRIRSDIERKRLGLALQPTAVETRNQPDDAPGLYELPHTNRTYAHMLECAQQCLEGGFNTIVDASFLNATSRLGFLDLAASRGIDCVILSCRADYAILAGRIEQRRRLHDDPSDADLGVLQGQLRNQEPLSLAERAHCIDIDTAEPEALPATLAAIQAYRGAHIHTVGA